MSKPTDSQLANAIRFLSVDAIVKAQEGHQGVPLGMAEIATALYANHLKFNPQEPTWWDRDRVVLSNGHGSMSRAMSASLATKLSAFENSALTARGILNTTRWRASK
jgi:transketolase